MHLKPWVAGRVAAPAMAAVALGLFPGQHSAPAPFAVAVVVRGGGWVGMQPVAQFNGAGWVNTWPAPEDRDVPVPDLLHVPDEWLGKPVSRQWTLWSASGGHLRARVASVRRADGCSAPATLVLQNTPATSPERLRGFQVAIDTNMPVEGFRQVANGEPEWAGLQAAITDTFRANEGSIGGVALIGASARLIGLPVAIESLVRPVSTSGPVVYYFEATKRLPMNRALGVSIAGWMSRSGRGRWEAREVSGRMLEQDSGPVPERTPLGLFRILGRVYWLVRIAGYEGTDTSLYEVSPAGAREVLTAMGSGC